MTGSTSITPAFSSRGLLIVFEGGDRAGKSTQIRRLHTEPSSPFAHVRTLLWRYPNRTCPHTGDMITRILRGDEEQSSHPFASHLIFSANRWVDHEWLKEHLNHGTHVLLDRYTHSGLVYSMAQGLDRAQCEQTEIGLVKPDLVIYLRVDPTVSHQRTGFGTEATERMDIQRRVVEGYDMYARENRDSWVVIDGTRTPDEVYADVVRVVNDRIQSPVTQLQYIQRKTE